MLALVSSPQGMTKSELLSTVYGYAAQTQSQQSVSAADRQFERDKEQVRKLGIPVEVIDSPLEPGNNQLARYRISKDRLQLPGQVRFSSEELAILRLAALAWSEGSLGAESRWASMKVASLGAGLDIRNLGIAPRLSITEPAAAALQQAIDERRTVRFDYQIPERDAPLSRNVAPLRLHRAEGRWHLIAHDLDRGEGRVFLLSRIASSVELRTEKYEKELLDTIDGLLEGMLALQSAQRVEVAVRRGTAAEARVEARSSVIERAGADPSLRVFDIGTIDELALAEELAGHGDEIEVRPMSRTRDAVLDRLRLVRDQHASTNAEV